MRLSLKLVIFDMDGLVVDSEKLYLEANQLAAHELGMGEYPLEYYKTFIGGDAQTMIAKLTKDYGSRELIDRFMKRSEELTHELVQAGQLELKPGFVNLANYLDEQHIPYVIASSNWRKAVDLFLATLRVKDRFQSIVTREDATNAKPDPEIFLNAWKLGGAPAKDETVVIEDSLNGVKAANAAGIPVILVPDLIQPDEKFAGLKYQLCDNLNDVKTLLEKAE